MKLTLSPHNPVQPHFLYFFSMVGVPLSLLIHWGGAPPPGGTCNRGGAYGRGLISVSKSIRFGYENSCKTSFGPLFFSASSGGVGVSITRACTLGESGSFGQKVLTFWADLLLDIARP